MLGLVATNHNDITRENFITHDLLPLARTMAPQRSGSHSHGAQTLEIGETLEHNCAFKEEEHKELHQTEVPVVVEQPQTGCKELEDKER